MSGGMKVVFAASMTSVCVDTFFGCAGSSILSMGINDQYNTTILSLLYSILSMIQSIAYRDASFYLSLGTFLNLCLSRSFDSWEIIGGFQLEPFVS